MKLTQKISIGIVILVVGLTAVVIVIANMAITQAIEDKVHRDMLAAHQIFKRFQELRFEQLLTDNRIAAEIPYLKAVVTTPDLESEVIEQIAGQVRENLKSDFLILSNLRGEPLATVSKKVPSDQLRFSDIQAVERALRGENFKSIWTSEKSVFQVVASPFRFGEEVVGALVTGFEIGSEEIVTLEQMTNTQAAVIGPESFVTSKAGASFYQFLRDEILKDRELPFEPVIKMKVQGEHYFLGVAPFENSALMVLLARSLDRELLFYSELRIRLLIVILLILFVALILGVIFSRKIAQPIRSLAESAGRISKGDFSVRVRSASRDEIGDLAQTFNEMTDNLRKSRQELISAKEFTDDIIRSMIDSLMVMNLNGTIRRINYATHVLLGYGEDELIGKPVNVVLGQEELASEGGFDGLIQNRSLQNLEKIYLTKDGQKIPVLFSAAVLRDTTHQIQGFVFVAQDIRRRKEMEARAIRSEKMAAIGQMASGITHEVKTPITAISGFAELMLQRMNLGEQNEKAVQVILREAQRCAGFVENLLSFAREEKPERNQLDIHHEIRGALSLVKLETKMKKIKVAEDFEQGLLEVLVNPSHIQQIVINLCSNAIDAMPEGGDLRVQTRRLDTKGQSFVELTVEDTGLGISPDIREKIFDPFFSTKEKSKGTGLGLALVYKMVHENDGEIKIESEVGKGTRIRILFPIPPPNV